MILHTRAFIHITAECFVRSGGRKKKKCFGSECNTWLLDRLSGELLYDESIN